MAKGKVDKHHGEGIWNQLKTIHALLGPNVFEDSWAKFRKWCETNAPAMFTYLTVWNRTKTHWAWCYHPPTLLATYATRTNNFIGSFHSTLKGQAVFDRKRTMHLDMVITHLLRYLMRRKLQEIQAIDSSEVHPLSLTLAEKRAQPSGEQLHVRIGSRVGYV